MNALRKHTASASEPFADDAVAPRQVSLDSFAYDDDVTPEGIAAVRERVAKLMPKGKYKVIDGYAGDRATRVG